MINKVQEFLRNIEISNLTVVYHDNCSDGLGSAYAAWKLFGDEAEYIGFDYNQNPSEITNRLVGKDIIFADVTLKRFEFLNVIASAKSVLVLDHHPSAYKDIGDLKCCIFDMTRSGAMLTWNCLHPNVEPPLFIKYIEDGDLWLFNYSETKAFYSLINHRKYNFKTIDQLLDPVFFEEEMKEGYRLHKVYEDTVLSIVETAVPVRFMGHDIYMVECNRDYASEVGNKLAKKSGSFSICHSQREDVYKVSLRGVDKVNLANLCTLFNGGGHPNASAFTTPTKKDFLNILKTHKETPIPTDDEAQQIREQLFRSQTKKAKP